MSFLKSQSGQSLIEVLAALAVVILVLLALIMATTISIRNATFARNQSLATGYAQEGMEEVRAYRDQNQTSFFAGTCPTLEDVSGFDREVTCEGISADKVKVTVTVSWEDAKGTHQSELITYLTRWQEVDED